MRPCEPAAASGLPCLRVLLENKITAKMSRVKRQGWRLCPVVCQLCLKCGIPGLSHNETLNRGWEFCLALLEAI